jgi:hypothetical protein
MIVTEWWAHNPCNLAARVTTKMCDPIAFKIKIVVLEFKDYEKICAVRIHVNCQISKSQFHKKMGNTANMFGSHLMLKI